MEERYTLPGQEEAESALRAAAARNALSHACVITGSGERLAAARFAAAACQCSCDQQSVSVGFGSRCADCAAEASGNDFYFHAKPFCMKVSSLSTGICVS